MSVLVIQSILHHLSPNICDHLPPSPSLSPPLGFIVFLLSIFSLDSVLIFCRNILILKAFTSPVAAIPFARYCNNKKSKHPSHVDTSKT
ncbi:hypothetical protein ACN38_g5128 [Penicillium nordicum]|uniref:Uncharacterized protein n=1 Tax=Penicillium nordicum TaxID=229535 RepID=A0A0M9WGH6_9EURO|nr:hypothetical protein ACN38_g5128 [Penicillium nordicum]